MTIFRSPTSASGELSTQERTELTQLLARWETYSHQTSAIDPSKIVPAINALYRQADLREPRVVIVPSPGVLAFAGGFASEIWTRRATQPTFGMSDTNLAVLATNLNNPLQLATLAAVQAATMLEDSVGNPKGTDVTELTRQASYDEADLATVNALDVSTWRELRDSMMSEAMTEVGEAIRHAMRDRFGNPTMTSLMLHARDDWALGLALSLFGDEKSAHAALDGARDWWQCSQSGNTSLYDEGCIAAARDVIQLRLSEHKKLAAWEQCAISGGYRYMHSEFCLVSDFPEMIALGHQRNHGDIAPMLRWRDGWTV